MVVCVVVGVVTASSRVEVVVVVDSCFDAQELRKLMTRTEKVTMVSFFIS